MRRFWSSFIWVLLSASLLAGCASTRAVNAMSGEALPAPDTSAASIPMRAAADYRVGPQDLLEISVFGVPDLSKTVRVGSSGEISMPLVGSVMAGGMTLPALEKLLAARLARGYLQNPQVSVFVKEFTSQRITLEGAVRKPGIYPITGKTSLIQAVALAGGLDPLADLGGVVVFRQIKGERMAAAFDMRAVRSGRSPDPQVYGEDIIVVEQSGSKTALRQFLEVLPVFGLFLRY